MKIKKDISEKEIYLQIKIPLLIAVITSVVSVICVLLTHYFTLKEIDYESAIQIVKENATVEELLEEAQKYYTIGEYAETVHIYNMDIVEQNVVALNNLGYMYEHGIIYGKDIEKAREYYKNAARLGNYDSLENYIIFTIKYPESFENLLNVLEWGYDEKSEIVDQFICSYYSKDDITKDDVQEFLQMDYERKIEILKYQIDMRLKEETEELADEMISENVYYETQERVTYKELPYDILNDGEKYIKRVPVTMTIPVGEVRTYYIDFLFTHEHDTKFIYL